MTALARTGKSEAFAERRVAFGVLATLVPPVGVLSFLSASTVGQVGPAGTLSPVILIFLGLAAAYIFAVTNAAFTAATHRRRARYGLLTALGARQTHLNKLLRWELGLPALLGVGIGIVTGNIAGFSFNPFASTFDPSESVWMPIGLLTSIAYIAIPSVLGVLMAAYSSANRVGRQTSAEQLRGPRADVNRYTKFGLLAIVVSVPVLVLSILGFSFSDIDWLQQVALLGFAAAVPGIILGTTLLTPKFLQLVSVRLFPQASTTTALRGLNDRPQRVLGLTGSVLALTTMLIMASAAIISDEDEGDSSGDRRQIVTSTAVLDAVTRLAQENDNAVVGSAAYRSSVGTDIIEAQYLGQETLSIKHQVADLTPEMIEAQGFTPDDVEFAAAGGLLVDSDVLGDLLVWNDSTDQYEPADTRIVRRAGGIGQPGPDIYVADRFGESTLANENLAVRWRLLVRFENPVSPALADALSTDMTVSAELPNSSSDVLFRWILAGVAAALLFSLALSTSNLTAVELEDEFSMLVALGASPKIRPRVLAAQNAWLFGTGTAVGSALGVALFWLVTRGDPTVPDPVVPVSAIALLLATAALGALIVQIMHGPAEPSLSSRPPTTIGA